MFSRGFNKLVKKCLNTLTNSDKVTSKPKMTTKRFVSNCNISGNFSKGAVNKLSVLVEQV